jgi:Ni/Co efflux regulator RcnB
MLHSLRYTLIACVLALALVASSIAAAAGPTATAAKKKHCKAGYHLVTVKKHGKKHKVCKKKHIVIQQQG